MSISDSAPSFSTMVTSFARASAAVASSPATIISPPSPVKHTAPRAGSCSAAAMPAGSA